MYFPDPKHQARPPIIRDLFCLTEPEVKYPEGHASNLNIAKTFENAQIRYTKSPFPPPPPFTERGSHI